MSLEKNLELVKYLEPQDVFNYFAEISSIARGSGNTNGIVQYLIDFAIKNNLKYEKDEYNNIMIYKHSKHKMLDNIALQAHIDMVYVKTPDCNKDTLKEGVDFKLDKDYLIASQTSLGADDGIGIAMILAVLANNKDYNRDIIGIFTDDEEVGLTGANNIYLDYTTCNKLINLDSEKFGILTVGCAGGNHIEYKSKVNMVEYEDSGFIELEISGGLGGHSARAVVENRANAILEMFNCLKHITSTGLYINLVSINGGEFDNSVPTQCKASIIICKANKDKIFNLIDEFSNNLKEKYKETDENLKLTYNYKVESYKYKAMNTTETQRIINCFTSLPNGVIEMNKDYPHIPLTSLNLGKIYMKDNYIYSVHLTRSNISKDREELDNKLTNIYKDNGFELVNSASYPAWEHKKGKLEERALKIFKEMFNQDMKVDITHGGLECGILVDKFIKYNPLIEAISIGPTAENIHSVDERLKIGTVKKTYDYLEKILFQCGW